MEGVYKKVHDRLSEETDEVIEQKTKSEQTV